MKNIYVVTMTDEEFGYTNTHYFTSTSKAFDHLMSLGYEYTTVGWAINTGIRKGERQTATVNKHEVNR